jgi:hypothetical protein
MSPDEQIVYDYTSELPKKKQISDATLAGNHCASRRRSRTSANGWANAACVRILDCAAQRFG